MANLPVLPRAQAPANGGGAFTREWYDFFRAIRPLAADSEALQAEIDAILVRLEALEDAPVTEATINGLASVQVLGSLESGLVQILLQGDSDSPGATFYYGTDASGFKGWHPVADTVLAASGELSKSVSGTGVTTFGLANLTNINDGVFQLFYRDGKGRVSGTLPGDSDDVPEGVTNLYFTNERVDDRVAALIVDSASVTWVYDDTLGTLTATASGGGSGDVVGPASSIDGNVALFDGTTGKLLKDGGALGTAAFNDTSDFATSAQGVLAASAVQPPDLATIAFSGDVSDLTGFPGGTTNFLRADGTFAPPGGGGATTFTGLTDTPGSYSGAADYLVKVKADETGLEFVSSGDTKSVVASEALSSGDFINLYDNGGVLNCRKADASIADAARKAHGYVLSSVSSSATASVYFDGFNPSLSSLTIGKTYVLSHLTAGGVVALDAATTTVGQCVQVLGVATDATEMRAEIEEPIIRG